MKILDHIRTTIGMIPGITCLVLVLLLISSHPSPGQTEIQQGNESPEVLTVKVKGITCGIDLKMISANVEKLEGVSSCEAGKTGPTTTFKISYDPELITDKDIYNAIQNTGSCDDPDKRPYKVKQ